MQGQIYIKIACPLSNYASGGSTWDLPATSSSSQSFHKGIRWAEHCIAIEFIIVNLCLGESSNILAHLFPHKKWRVTILITCQRFHLDLWQHPGSPYGVPCCTTSLTKDQCNIMMRWITNLHDKNTGKTGWIVLRMESTCLGEGAFQNGTKHMKYNRYFLIYRLNSLIDHVNSLIIYPVT